MDLSDGVKKEEPTSNSFELSPTIVAIGIGLIILIVLIFLYFTGKGEGFSSGASNPLDELINKINEKQKKFFNSLK